MPDLPFDDRIAKHYEALWPEIHDPAVIEPTVDFLADLAGGGPALELGIGTGRIALPLADRGVRVHGIELSAAMIAELRTKPGADRIGVTIGDFATATVDERFSVNNPITVRLLRRASTPLDVRSRGTAQVVDAMRAAGVRRLVVQSTYGIGETYASLPLSLKIFFSLVIRPQVRDHVRQEELVRRSGLDWTVVRPVVLNDDDTNAPAKVDLADRVESMKVSRTQLARVLAEAVGRVDWHGQTLSVSG